MEAKCGNKLIYYEIDKNLEDVIFSNTTITRSVYYMVQIICFKDLSESISDYRRIVLLMFQMKNDIDVLHECGFIKQWF